MNCAGGPVDLPENYGFSRREIKFPRAISAHYDRDTRHVAVHLISNLIANFSPGDIDGLEFAQHSKLRGRPPKKVAK